MPDLLSLSDSQRHSVLAHLCRFPDEWHTLTEIRQAVGQQVTPSVLKGALAPWTSTKKMPGCNSNAPTRHWKLKTGRLTSARKLLNDFRARLNPRPPRATP